jgi:hypothetical protein
MSLAVLARKSRSTAPRFRREKRFVLNMTGRGQVIGQSSKAHNSKCKTKSGCKDGHVSRCCGAANGLDLSGCKCDCWRGKGSRPAPQMCYNNYLNRRTKGAHRPGGGGVCCDTVENLRTNKVVCKKVYPLDSGEALEDKKDVTLWWDTIYNKKCAELTGRCAAACDIKNTYVDETVIKKDSVKKNVGRNPTDVVRYTRMEKWCGITKTLPYKEANEAIALKRALRKCWSKPTIRTFFSSINSNSIFRTFSNSKIGHHVSIKYSGIGGGGGISFNSLQFPYSTSSYLALDGANSGYPLPIITMCDNVEAHDFFQNTAFIATPPFQGTWPGALNTTDISNSQGRFIQSKTLSEMNIGKQKGNSKTKISSWEQLEEITIVWIAGNGSNGGDKPDVKKINSGFNEIYGFRKPERLSIEFFDVANKCMSNSQKILFDTKERDPTQAEITNGESNNSSIYGNISSIIYQGNKFTTSVIKASEFGDLSKASTFVIGQPRHTSILDNYGIKFVSLKFNY